MRDPARIYEFCNRLAAVWQKVPDWRFGQFIDNVFTALGREGIDPFFPEDDYMISKIESYFQQE